MNRLVYVAGYSRSGSTILGLVLGSHTDIFYAGELTYLLDDWATPQRTCSCGAPYASCAFWAGAADDTTAASRNRLRAVERRSAFPGLYVGRPASGAGEYGDRYRDILEHARRHSGKAIVLDSSKSARDATGRPIALRDYAGQDVDVVHLVRSGIATLRSYSDVGSNWAAEGHGETARWPVARATAGWTLANASASLLARTFGDRYLRVRYEDLMASPAHTLAELGRFLRLDITDLIDRVDAGASFPVEHPVGGNRLRLAGEVRLRRGRPVTDASGLRPYQRALFHGIGGVLNARYGYYRGPAKTADATPNR